MSQLNLLKSNVESCLGAHARQGEIAFDEYTLTVPVEHIKLVLTTLRDDPSTAFDQLIDLCGVDYSEFTQHQDCTLNTLH